MFADVNDLRFRPLPSLESARAMKQGYRDWPIDNSGALFGESLVSVGDFGVEGRNYYAHARNPPYWAAAPGAIDVLLLRKSVAERLRNVNDLLRVSGLKLFLFDAWRPREVQAFFHDIWVPAQLRKRRPELSDAELEREVTRYWAAPTENVLRPAPHATGGAVDLTLAWDDGQPLWMGSLFDDPNAVSHSDHFERDQGAWSFSNEEARANRRLIFWVMTEAGFASHPDEWWHFSWGDQMWAALTGQPKAHYGPVEPSPTLTEAS